MSPATAPKRILIIDDDDALTGALVRLLQAEGYQVRCAADGEEGIRLAEQEPPDLVLLDFMMPLKNGFDVCTDMQNIANLRNVPVLVMTAFGQDIGETHGVSMQKPPSNIRGRLEKPFEINVLLERMVTALEEGSPAAPSRKNP
ncbi:MAG: response regulator [Candidatus Brocadiia bacterium]|jgi:DNA-binding response OmpR family regulator